MACHFPFGDFVAPSWRQRTLALTGSFLSRKRDVHRNVNERKKKKRTLGVSKPIMGGSLSSLRNRVRRRAPRVTAGKWAHPPLRCHIFLIETNPTVLFFLSMRPCLQHAVYIMYRVLSVCFIARHLPLHGQSRTTRWLNSSLSKEKKIPAFKRSFWFSDDISFAFGNILKGLREARYSA